MIVVTKNKQETVSFKFDSFSPTDENDEIKLEQIRKHEEEKKLKTQ